MKKLRITLEGKTYDVCVEELDDTGSSTVYHTIQPPPPQQSAPAPRAAGTPVSSVKLVAEGCRVVSCPMAGLVFKCLVKPGDVVTLNQVLIVLDAMKMETPVVSPVSGTVRVVLVKEGDAVDEDHALLQIEESS